MGTRINNVFPLVNVCFVAGTGCISNAHVTTIKICVILSLRSEARIHTGRNLGLSEGQKFCRSEKNSSLT